MKLHGLKIQPLLLALTVINLGLFGYTISQQSAQAAPGNDGVIRGKRLEIVDDQGRVRASIAINPTETLRDGSVYPENVLLRLITAEGRPSVKLQAGEDRSGMSLSDAKGLSYVQVLAQGDKPEVNIVDKAGKKATTLP